MKLSHLAPLMLSVAALTSCNLLKGTKGDDGGASAAGSGGSGGTSLAAKALSLLGVGNDAFEGDITMTTTSAAAPAAMAIVYEVKGDKLRFDQPGGKPGYVIFNAPEKKMYMVDDTAKQAIVMDFSKDPVTPPSVGTHAPTAAATASDNDFSIDMSGGDDVVAGYTCGIWKITETNKTTGKVTKSDACLAKGIGFPDMSMGRGGKTWMSKLTTDRFFPLRVVSSENGVEKSRMLVTKIDKKTLAPARFEVPPGYKVIDMADMFKGLGGMGKPPHI